uniref:Uncharacterized protein n=1 Tax=Salarias fasciatus TaxID=181472 RepID=A0A672GQI6_SALFA
MSLRSLRPMSTTHREHPPPTQNPGSKPLPQADAPAPVQESPGRGPRRPRGRCPAEPRPAEAGPPLALDAQGGQSREPKAQEPKSRPPTQAEGHDPPGRTGPHGRQPTPGQYPPQRSGHAPRDRGHHPPPPPTHSSHPPQPNTHTHSLTLTHTHTHTHTQNHSSLNQPHSHSDTLTF